MIRLDATNAKTNYDERHDVFHVFVCPMSPSYDDEDYPGIVVRRSMRDDRVTGITVLDFSKRPKQELARNLPFVDPDILHMP